MGNRRGNGKRRRKKPLKRVKKKMEWRRRRRRRRIYQRRGLEDDIQCFLLMALTSMHDCSPVEVPSSRMKEKGAETQTEGRVVRKTLYTS